MEANAALIAAAPELYEALDGLFPAATSDSLGTLEMIKRVAAARAALAKARGET
jgi:hypothetical protein